MTEVDICNQALANLGDDATVSSINPSDGSAQADLCSRFYPQARDSLLEMYAWGFATKRVTLALLGSNWSEWKYAYAVPNDALNLLAVMAIDAPDDYVAPGYVAPGYVMTSILGAYTQQPFVAENDGNGNQIIYTNIENAVLRYTAQISDTSLFSPLFTDTLAWLLTSKLAGPILKGNAGESAIANAYKMFRTLMSQATQSDANQRKINLRPQTVWMANR
jgi:hypothetical protein